MESVRHFGIATACVRVACYSTLPLALLAAFAIPFNATVAYANPQGGVVSAGQATINSSGNVLTVQQSSDRTVIDWRGFDVAPNETTQFQQPSNSAIALNRVNSNSASHIDGNLTANGNVVIVNQNGVMFGAGANVNVNSLVATTADIDNNQFMAGGNLAFTTPGNPDAAIVNNGVITAGQAGLVGFVAPNVVNNGIITANLGKVHLASGDTATVDMYGDGMMNVAVSDAVTSQLVSNSGLIQANGGKIALTAAAGNQIVNSLITNSGVIQAESVGQKNGKIVLYAEGSNAVKGNVAANKGVKQGTSTVINSGVLDASGYGNGQTGGNISVLGDNVGILNGSYLDASGDIGGGYIKIGGDFHGSGKTPTALNTYVDANSLIMANANTSGNGGNVAVWSDNNTWFLGNIMAEGGKNSGNGGFVETSGHGTLDAEGYVDLLALNGNKGTYLLDPSTIEIYGNVTPAFNATDSSISLSSSLQLWLDASNQSSITLSYNSTGDTASGTSGQNTITVSANTGLVVGERIQLGGSTHSYAASVNDNNADGVYTITAISGTTVTLDANLGSTYSAGTTLYGGFVSQMNDLSGNGNNVSQGTASREPLWISNSQNGIGQAIFSNDWLTASSSTLPLGSNAWTIFTMFSSTGGGALGGWGTNSSGGERYDVYIPSGVEVESHESAVATTSAISTNTPYIFGDVYSGGSLTNSTTYLDGTTNVASPGCNCTPNVTVSGIVIGSIPGATNNANFSGKLGDYIVYNTNLSTNAQALINQYESAKWGIALTGPGNATGESGLTGPEAQAAMASTQAGATTDGYSVFSDAYLTRLSATSNIILEASGAVTLDLQGDNMALSSGKSLAITSTGGNITFISPGTITTNNANITLTPGSGDSIILNSSSAVTLASQGGAIDLAGAVSLSSALTVNSGGGAVTFGSTVNGAQNLTVNDGTGGSTTLSGAIGGTTPLNAVSLTTGSSITLPAISAASLSVNTTAASDSITVGGALALSGTSGTDVTLSSYSDIISSHTITGQGGAIILDSDTGGSGGAINVTANITSDGGPITMGGNEATPSNIVAGTGYAIGDGYQAAGIKINASTINSGSGNIVINGQGLGTGSNIGSAYGIEVQAGGVVETSGTGSTGTITMNGIGGGTGTGSDNMGVYLTGTNTAVTVINGNLSFTATGGAGTGTGTSGGTDDRGFCLVSNAVVQTTGTGTLSITGIGGGAGSSQNNNEGIDIESNGVKSTATNGGGITLIGYSGDNGGSSITNAAVFLYSGAISSVDGNILIDGNTGVGGQTVSNTTGSSSGFTNSGIQIANGSTITSTGNATITLNGFGAGGTGSGGYDYGVFVTGTNTKVTSATGNISITGTGASTTGGNSSGVSITSSGVVTTTGSGSITITGAPGSGAQQLRPLRPGHQRHPDHQHRQYHDTLRHLLPQRREQHQLRNRSDAGPLHPRQFRQRVRDARHGAIYQRPARRHYRHQLHVRFHLRQQHDDGERQHLDDAGLLHQRQQRQHPGIRRAVGQRGIHLHRPDHALGRRGQYRQRIGHFVQ